MPRFFLSEVARSDLQKNLVTGILYADDTLIYGSRASSVQEFAGAVERAGVAYGMTLHWGKTQALSIGDAGPLYKPDGTMFEDAGCLGYLGAMLSSDGRVDSELSRKLGAARGDFNQLQKLWGHGGIPRHEKVRFFDALVLSKLRYGLETVWLRTSQRRRVDGFVARCLRRVLSVPAAFVSRVSNATVYSKACMALFSQQVVKHQMFFLRKVAMEPEGKPLRRDTFVGASLDPLVGHYIRRPGRPRQDWTTELLRQGCAKMGAATFYALLRSCGDEADGNWKREVAKLF